MQLGDLGRVRLRRAAKAAASAILTGCAAVVASASPAVAATFQLYPSNPDPRQGFLVTVQGGTSRVQHLLEIEQDCNSSGTPLAAAATPDDGGEMVFPVRRLPCPGEPVRFTLTTQDPGYRIVDTYIPSPPQVRSGVRMVPYLLEQEDRDGATLTRYLPLPGTGGGFGTRDDLDFGLAGLRSNTGYFLYVKLLGRSRPQARCKKFPEHHGIGRTDATGQTSLGVPADMTVRADPRGDRGVRPWCAGRQYRIEVRERGTSRTRGSIILRVRR